MGSYHTPGTPDRIARGPRQAPVESCKEEVQGFVIFGLTEEALLCNDMIFSAMYLLDMYASAKSFDSIKYPEPFRREMVDVEISLRGGETMTFEATIYVWTAPSEILSSPWEINKFVKSESFRKVSGALSSPLWFSEEEEIARDLGLEFVLTGDALVNAILHQDETDVLTLLSKGDDCDVNAPCQGYGTALQAASAVGLEKPVSLLLRLGAMVNAPGGQYDSALVAATVRGHEQVARILIESGADVLKQSPSYVSSIYQAVSRSDVSMVLMLLERGAWLTTDYDELADLASEKGNDEVISLLIEYDTRDSLIKRRRSSGAPLIIGREVVSQPLNILQITTSEALKLKGTPGK